jgi:hypothetical protein
MQRGRSAVLPWRSDAATAARVEALALRYRRDARTTLTALVTAWYPALAVNDNLEFRKMIELSSKMTLVGHACAEVAGYEFDERRQRIATLFGCICFLADSFLDDFGAAATRDYIARFSELLETGWFELRSERETLFYVVLCRLVRERDVLDPVVRQAILRLHAAQTLDVELRLDPLPMLQGSRRQRITQLKRCARDRSGHAIIALTAFLVPALSLDRLAALFVAGALIMYIDDHGDCFTDRRDGRITYMNQLNDPERALKRLAIAHFARLARMLDDGPGRDLLLGFLLRYYVTRIEKHRIQRLKGGTAWDVYE